MMIKIATYLSDKLKYKIKFLKTLGNLRPNWLCEVVLWPQTHAHKIN